MSSNFKKVVESLPLLTTDDLDDLQDAIMDELKVREHKQMRELREKAIEALNDYFQAGGYIMNNTSNFNFGIDEDLISTGDENCIYLR